MEQRKKVKTEQHHATYQTLKESGNVFFALFGAVGLVGVLGASTMTVMKGPVKSMQEITKRTIAENNMIAAGKLAVMVSSQPGGDCDTDGTVEPPAWESTAGPKPGNGGLLPATIGAAKEDPWGNDYGYCVWDHGTVIKDGSCSDDANRLSGSPSGVGMVVAVISSGPDRIFQTDCNAEGGGDYVDKPTGSDDVILSYTYNEAQAVAGGSGLWAPEGTTGASIERDIEVRADGGGAPVFSVDRDNTGKPAIKVDFIQQLNGSVVEFLSDLKGTNVEATGNLNVGGTSTLGAVNAGATDVTTLDADSATISGALGAGSAAVTGALTAGSANVSGTLDAGSADIAGALEANSATISGGLSAGDSVLNDTTLNSLEVTTDATIGTDLTVDTNTLTVDSTSNLVGIGTASPIHTLDLWGDAGVTGPPTGSSALYLYTLTDGSAYLGDAGNRGWGIFARRDQYADLNQRDDLAFSFWNGASWSSSLYMDSTTDYIGIGTFSPSAKLDVAGSAEINGALDMTTHAIENLLTPTTDYQAANKKYVDDAIIAGVSGNETDPTIGTLENGKWCTSDGTQINCTDDPPAISDSDTLGDLGCNVGEVAKWDGSSWVCAADNNTGTDSTCEGGGETWTARPAAEANQWYGITYGAGLFVAVAADGTNQIMTSPDGVNWTPRATPSAGSAWRSVTYGNGLFVAVAYSGIDRLITSPDGINWTARSIPQANAWHKITYGDGLFVAVANSGTSRIMTSPDGINWTSRSQPSGAWYGISYGNSTYVGVSINTNQAMTSSDGVTWTGHNAPESNMWQDVAFGNGLFVAVATSGTNQAMTSPDGVTWTPRSTPAGSWYSVTYGGDKFVAVGASGAVMTSTDGITWTSQTAAESNTWRYITYGAGKFVAVSNNGTNRVMTSFQSCDGGGLSSLSCNDGQVAKYDSNADSWYCANDALYSLSCQAGEIAKWNGSSWSCSPDKNDGTDEVCTGPLNTQLDIESGDSYGTWSDGEYVFVASQGDGVKAYSFDGTSLTFLDDFDTAGNVYNVWGDDDYIYIYDSTNGLYALSFDGSSFTQAGNFPSAISEGAVWGDGQYIYITVGVSGITALSFDGSSFTQEGTIVTPAWATDIWGDDNYIYVGSTSRLLAYTFNGTTFTEVGNLSASNPRYVYSDGNYVYSTRSTSGGIYAYSFNGSSFTLLDSLSTPPWSLEMSGDDNYIYLAAREMGIQAYSFDGTDLTHVATYGPSGYPQDSWSDGTYLYVGSSGGGFQVFDLGGCTGGGFEALNCTDGQIPKFSADNGWQCAADATGGGGSVPGGSEGDATYVNFDGTSCTGGSGSDCTIRSSQNIERVERVSQGDYLIHFDTDFDDSNYLVFVTGADNSKFECRRIASTAKTASAVSVTCVENSESVYRDVADVNVMAFTELGGGGSGSGEGGGSEMSGDVGFIAKADVANLGSDWTALSIGGQFSSSDAGPAGGYIINNNGSMHAAVYSATGGANQFTVTTSWQTSDGLALSNNNYRLRLNGTDLEIETGTDIQLSYMKLSGGGSGSGSGGGSEASSMIEDWPDAIVCTNGPSKKTAYLRYTDATETMYSDLADGSDTRFYVRFNAVTRAYTTHANYTGYDCLNKSIDQLISEEKTFNFVGGGGGSGEGDNLGDHQATQGVVFHAVTGAAPPINAPD